MNKWRVLLEPIEIFKTDREARECLREWQHRLYLDEWIIKVLLVDPTETAPNQGDNEYDTVHHAARIQIAKLSDTERDTIVKCVHEVTLVHELLHCKFSYLDTIDQTTEGYCYDKCHHSLIDHMARSLIMAKYNIGPEWFNNIAYKEVEPLDDHID